jgi:uncharacterized protein
MHGLWAIGSDCLGIFAFEVVMALDISSQDWSDFLIRIGAVCGPAELHGMLCGSLCGGKLRDAEQWVAEAYEFLDLLSGTDEQEVHTALGALFDLVEASLKEQSYSLQLLLPDDAVPLPDRTAALATWCQGFLFGFGSTAGLGESLDFDGKEALQDLAQIAQLEQNETSDADEALYAELVEYVRLAVFDIYAQINIHQDDAEVDLTDTRH